MKHDEATARKMAASQIATLHMLCLSVVAAAEQICRDAVDGGAS